MWVKRANCRQPIDDNGLYEYNVHYKVNNYFNRLDKQMIEVKLFKEWLLKHTEYSSAVTSDIVSRMKRADYFVTWEPTTTYLFKLEQNADFKKLSISVKSQIRGAVKHYIQFVKDTSNWGAL